VSQLTVDLELEEDDLPISQTITTMTVDTTAWYMC